MATVWKLQEHARWVWQLEDYVCIHDAVGLGTWLLVDWLLVDWLFSQLVISRLVIGRLAT
jgi:hypothetical protein